MEIAQGTNTHDGWLVVVGCCFSQDFEMTHDTIFSS